MDESLPKRKKVEDGFSPNPHLPSLPQDNLYHLGLTTKDHDFENLFADVKFVVMGGSPNRMEKFSWLLADMMKLSPEERNNIDITKTDRYRAFKIGPVLVFSHGMGVPSVTILLHEVFKLLHYAKCSGVSLIRLGTCGGIGLEAGTIVVSEKVVNAKLKEEHDVYILGNLVSREAKLDKDLAHELLESQTEENVCTVLGTTMCTDDFYEGQGRIDGALCEYSNEDRLDFLKKLKEAGVTNIEMEATAIGSLCSKAGVAGAIVCVALLDRLHGDQVDIAPDDYAEYQRRLQMFVANFIVKKMALLSK